PPPTEAILTALLNDIASIRNDFVLVLDDYHVIDATPVDLALTFLLDHLPPRMHLVIATREDPQLPLAQLRARGHLTELRAADLLRDGLRRRPEQVRGVLLQTAILDRLHGSLCDAVTGQEGGAARLATLERGNFFVVPLDDQRHWYRYHHLFADVLSAHLLA